MELHVGTLALNCVIIWLRCIFHVFLESCVSLLYVMAFTSGIQYAGSDKSPYITIRLTTGETNTRLLYNRPGDDMFPHKGDLWKFQISDFGFNTSCITKSRISQVSIRKGDYDSWNIESIMTVLYGCDGKVEILTTDFHVNRWIDRRKCEFFLTKV